MWTSVSPLFGMELVVAFPSHCPCLRSGFSLFRMTLAVEIWSKCVCVCRCTRACVHGTLSRSGRLATLMYLSLPLSSHALRSNSQNRRSLSSYGWIFLCIFLTSLFCLDVFSGPRRPTAGHARPRNISWPLRPGTPGNLEENARNSPRK